MSDGIINMKEKHVEVVYIFTSHLGRGVERSVTVISQYKAFNLLGCFKWIFDLNIPNSVDTNLQLLQKERQMHSSKL